MQKFFRNRALIERKNKHINLVTTCSTLEKPLPIISNSASQRLKRIYLWPAIEQDRKCFQCEFEVNYSSGCALQLGISYANSVFPYVV